MIKLLIFWFITSLIMGLITNIKVNGKRLSGYKRFVISFVFGFPFALLFSSFLFMLIPLLILLVIVSVLLFVVKIF